MATLSSQHILCCGIDSANVIGLESDKTEEFIIVTVNRNIIIKFKLTDKKPVKTWSTLRGQFFTAPAIWNSCTEKYVAVINHKQIYLWDGSDESWENITKYSFNSTIHSLIASEICGCFVLYENGVVEPLEVAIESRKNTKSGPIIEHDILDYFLNENQDHVYSSIFTWDKNCKVYQLFLGSYGNNKEPIHESYTIKNNTLSLLGSCFLCSDNMVKLITLWSDGSLWSFDTSQPVSNSLGHRILFINNINLSFPCSLATISPSHLCIYGAQKDNEGAITSVWDMKFGIQLSKQRLKMYTPAPHLWNIAHHIFVLMDDKILCLPYRVTTSRLASVIGHYIGDKESLAKGILNVRNECKEPRRLILYLENQFPQLYGNNIPESVLTSTLLPLIIENNFLPELFVCLKQFEDFHERIVVQLVTHILKLDLEIFTKHEMIFDCVIIDQEESSLDKRESWCHPIQSLLLNLLFGVSLNEASLRESLKLISADTVKVLLTYLHSCLAQCNLYDISHVSLQMATPPSAQILMWINCLLDSSFNGILMTSDLDVHKILFDIADTVNHHVTISNELATIEGPLMIIKNKNEIPKRSFNSDYFIEIVQF